MKAIKACKATLLAGLAVLGGLTATGSAGTLDITKVSGYYDTSGSGGGEFTVHLDDLNVLSNYNAKAKITTGSSSTFNGVSFQTFCLERTEGFPGSLPEYDVSYTLNLNGWALSGGVDNQSPGDGHDEISVGTAFLYSRFAAGTLSVASTDHYDYTDLTDNGGVFRGDSAEMLQKAIWYLEDELDWNSAGGTNNKFLTLLGSTKTAIDLKKVDSNGADNVYVLNLGTSSNGYKYQDQLVMYVPPYSAPHTVPDGGATLMLMGLAMGGVAFLRRKLA